MYCKHCSKMIDEDANICPYCGAPTEKGLANGKAGGAGSLTAAKPKKKSKAPAIIIGIIITIIILIIALPKETSDRTDSIKNGYFPGLDDVTVGNLLNYEIKDAKWSFSGWGNLEEEGDLSYALLQCSGKWSDYDIKLTLGQYVEGGSVYVITNKSSFAGEELTKEDPDFLISQFYKDYKEDH